jgi:hypothetical protein
MEDLSKAIEFARNINVDGRFEGERVTLSGFFLKQELGGVASLAHSQYQFVVNEQFALVASIPESFVPKESHTYCVTGRLMGTGEFGMFPGIEIESAGDA